MPLELLRLILIVILIFLNQGRAAPRDAQVQMLADSGLRVSPEKWSQAEAIQCSDLKKNRPMSPGAQRLRKSGLTGLAKQRCIPTGFKAEVVLPRLGERLWFLVAS